MHSTYTLDNKNIGTFGIGKGNLTNIIAYAQLLTRT